MRRRRLSEEAKSRILLFIFLFPPACWTLAAILKNDATIYLALGGPLVALATFMISIIYDPDDGPTLPRM